MTTPSFAASVRRIVPLAWPVLVGQLALLAFSTVDTVLVACHSATDLAALAIGAAMYITVFIGLVGVVLAIGPIVGQLYGAGRLAEAGRQMDQTIWLAWGLTAVGSVVLAVPDPLLAVSNPSPEVETKVRGYLLALAFSLPASLLFTVYRGFNVAVSRPKAVMALQLAGLAIKIPCSAALAYGVPAWGLTPLELGHLTSAVQLGFISGTLGISLSGLADRFSASRIFAVCAMLGALANTGFAFLAGGIDSGILWRFAVGLSLAGVYPLGMKLVVSWEPERAGAALAWLVGMLTKQSTRGRQELSESAPG